MKPARHGAGCGDLCLDPVLLGLLHLRSGAAGYQFIETYNWLPALGISLPFGVDGMSAPLVLLTGVVMFTGVLISWGDGHGGIQDRPREFFAFLFILASGVFGVFVSLDLFMLFFFYEIAVFPMYLLIAIWGWVADPRIRGHETDPVPVHWLGGFPGRRAGHVLGQYQNTGVCPSTCFQMEQAGFSQAFQDIWFLPVFLGFAVLGGIWPFHNWSPDGHVAAPTAVSMFHAGVLMKLGAFAALRVGIMLLPRGRTVPGPGSSCFLPRWLWSMARTSPCADGLKYMIGFSSVSHMGLVMLGFSTLNQTGLTGAGVQMFSHGVMTALFFAVVGMIYDRAHTRQIPELGGMSKSCRLLRSALSSAAWFPWACPASPVLWPSSPSSWVSGKSPWLASHSQHFDCHHGGLYHAQHPAGLL
jgi:NADH-quinone oxidoreductase subunit M